jgi:formylglycine-generating enzyme required for sulfatase activity
MIKPAFKLIKKYTMFYSLLVLAAGFFVSCPQPYGEEPPDPTWQLVSVPGGTVTPGSPWTWPADYPLPYVMKPFQIGANEVTYQHWYTVRVWAEKNGYSFIYKGQEGVKGTAGAAPAETGKPVCIMTWMDTVVWCNAYSEKSSRTPVYRNSSGGVIKKSEDTPVTVNATANGYRLATKAEWEYAGRGGDPGIAAWSYTYAGGNILDEVGYQVFGPTLDAIAVRSKRPNRLGIYDMTGNVWEWVYEKGVVGASFASQLTQVTYFISPKTAAGAPGSGDIGFRIASNAE